MPFSPEKFIQLSLFCHTLSFSLPLVVMELSVSLIWEQSAQVHLDVAILDSHSITQPKLEEKYSTDLGFFLITQIKKLVIPYPTFLTLGQLDQLERNPFIKFFFLPHIRFQWENAIYSFFAILHAHLVFIVMKIMIYHT